MFFLGFLWFLKLFTLISIYRRTPADNIQIERHQTHGRACRADTLHSQKCALAGAVPRTFPERSRRSVGSEREIRRESGCPTPTPEFLFFLNFWNFWNFVFLGEFLDFFVFFWNFWKFWNF